MINACPYCGRRMRHGVYLTPKLIEVFDVIERAGSAGIASRDAVRTLYPRAYTTRHGHKAFNANVRLLNKLLQPVGICITGERGSQYHEGIKTYRVVQFKQKAAA